MIKVSIVPTSKESPGMQYKELELFANKLQREIGEKFCSKPDHADHKNTIIMDQKKHFIWGSYCCEDFKRSIPLK